MNWAKNVNKQKVKKSHAGNMKAKLICCFNEEINRRFRHCMSLNNDTKNAMSIIGIRWFYEKFDLVFFALVFEKILLVRAAD